jgi:transcriptional regulator with XRE-family HTH domain
MQQDAPNKLLTIMRLKMEKTVSQRIKAAMDHFQWDDQRLADAIGKHRTTVTRIVNEQTNPTKSTVHLIANALKVNFAYLQLGKGPMIVEDKVNDSETSLLERALSKLEQQLDKKDEVIQTLSNLLMNMGGPGPNGNFLRLINEESTLVEYGMTGS